jgi:hypothetical protein
MKKLAFPIAVLFSLLVVAGVLAAGTLNLPAYPVTALYGPWPQGTNSTMDVTLSGVGAGFDVTDGVYAGWCIQDHVLGGANQVTLYSSDDPNMPADALVLPWNKINYVLNHKQGDKFDVQTAIWLLLGEQNPDFGPKPLADAMVADANANGGSFVPGPGQIIAVLLYSDGMGTDPLTVQEVIIQVTLPGDNGGGEGCTPGYWKQPQHFDSWVGYTQGQTLESVFDVPNSYGMDNKTLLQALSFQGGSSTVGAAEILLRASVAALLNSSSVNYPLTTADLIAQVNAALASGNRGTMLNLAAQLDLYNNLGCPLN